MVERSGRMSNRWVRSRRYSGVIQLFRPARPTIGQQSDGAWAVFDKPGTPFWYARFSSWRDAARAWVLWERALKAARGDGYIEGYGV